MPAGKKQDVEETRPAAPSGGNDFFVQPDHAMQQGGSIIITTVPKLGCLILHGHHMWEEWLLACVLVYLRPGRA